MANGQSSREVELTSPADEVYTIYRRACYLFPTIFSSDIKGVNLIDGTWESLHSQRRWTFDANRGTWLDTVDTIIEDKKSITFTLREEVVPKKLYKSLRVTYQFTSQRGGCMATVTMEYDMTDANADPNDYLTFAQDTLKAVDRYLQATRNP